MTTQVPAVFAAINAVTDELRKVGIGKNKRAQGTFSFAYRGIDDVYAALSPALVAHHLVIAPITIEKEADLVLQKGHTTRIKVTYAVVSTEDGSRIEVQSLGEGADTSDKGTGKAMSYAYKNLVFQLFCTPVAGQEDTDAETIETTVSVSEDLLLAAEDAANEGIEAYKAFWSQTSKPSREALQKSGHHDRLKAIAKGATQESI